MTSPTHEEDRNPLQDPILEENSRNDADVEISGEASNGGAAFNDGRQNFRYESTVDGDIRVVETFVGDEDESTRAVADPSQEPGSPSITSGNASGWKSSPPSRGGLKRRERRHSRNLSAHFFDATKITDGSDDDDAQVEKTFSKVVPDGSAFRPPQNSGTAANSSSSSTSPMVGQKHRRMFSGDVSNPPLAHRRINSIGNAAAIDRYLQRPRNRHRREDSAGLDILSAAADVTNDELADIAGARTSPVWGAAPPPPGTGHHARFSSLDYYDYRDGAPSARPPPPPPPPGPPGLMKPPPQAYHHPYASQHSSIHHPTITYHHHHPPPPPHPHHAHHFYPPPPPGHAAPPPPPPRSYPVQYSHHYRPMPPPPPPPSADIYRAPPTYPPPLEDSAVSAARQPSPVTAYEGEEKIESDEKLFANKSTEEAARATTTTQDSDPLAPAQASAVAAHHRKLSSFSSINALISANIFSPEGTGDHPLKSHHRSTSSTVSFLQGLDVLEGSDVMFLRNLQASTPNYGGPDTATTTAAPPPPPGPYPVAESIPSEMPPLGGGDETMKSNSTAPPLMPAMPPLQPTETTAAAAATKLASGGTSKRVRRKCTIEGCTNRVVQGGLCIAHGAKRKICNHPGCTKNVKKAGMCSTHGPARKRCEADGCNKVAVQGGRCIAHGAKKKMCSVESCKKQAILGGMCKKHHDKLGVAVDPNNQVCVPIGAKSGANHKSGHTRGLSIFQDLSADAVQNLLSGDDPLNL